MRNSIKKTLKKFFRQELGFKAIIINRITQRREDLFDRVTTLSIATDDDTRTHIISKTIQVGIGWGISLLAGT